MRLVSVLKEAISTLREPEEGVEGASDLADREAAEKAAAAKAARQMLFDGVEFCQNGKIKDAVDVFQDAYLAYVKISDRRSAALCMKILSLLFTAMKDPDFVKRAFQRAEKQLSQAGLRDEAARMIMLRARFEAGESERFYKMRDFKTAKEVYKTAVTSYKQSRRAFGTLGLLEGEAEVALEHASLDISKADKCSAAKLVSEIIDAAKLVNRHDVREQAEQFAKQHGL